MPVANVSAWSSAATSSGASSPGVEQLEAARAVLLLGPGSHARAPGVDLRVVVAVHEVDGLELGHAATLALGRDVHSACPGA